MIIKIKTNNVNVHLSDSPTIVESWRLFEGVQGLHYTTYASESDLKSFAGKQELVEGVQEIWLVEPKPVDDIIMFLSFFSEATGATQIYCNTECYLLNDNGKTIERIY